jgi:hypothetical protein
MALFSFSAMRIRMFEPQLLTSWGGLHPLGMKQHPLHLQVVWMMMWMSCDIEQQNL